MGMVLWMDWILFIGNKIATTLWEPWCLNECQQKFEGMLVDAYNIFMKAFTR
jgi:hypothetical protein